MRRNFNHLFHKNEDGSLTPIRRVDINGIIFGPGVSFGPGVVFGGVNLFDFINNDIEAEENNNGVFVIKGFYRNS